MSTLVAAALARAPLPRANLMDDVPLARPAAPAWTAERAEAASAKRRGTAPLPLVMREDAGIQGVHRFALGLNVIPASLSLIGPHRLLRTHDIIRRCPPPSLLPLRNAG